MQGASLKPHAALLALSLALAATGARAEQLPPAPPQATQLPPPETPAAAAGTETNPPKDEAPDIYSLPIFGRQAREAGADLPLPVGISIIGQYQRENVRTHNLQVALGKGDFVDASFVGFGGNTTRANNLLFRGDLWLFPFLNVYGIAGESWSDTQTTLGPDPVILSLPTDSHGTTLGFGVTLAYGIGAWFITLDGNLTWADQEILSTPQRTLTVTPRLGRRWVSETRPGSAFSLWVGATMEEFENAAVGEVSLGSTFSGGASALANVLAPNFSTWLAANPAAKDSVNQLLSEFISDLDPKNPTARFNVGINPAKAWNMVLGGEMDLNKHWQLIAEAGFFGARTSVMGSVCYRFGI